MWANGSRSRCPIVRSGSTGGRGAPPTTRQTASPSTSRSTWPSSCSAPNALDLEATVGQRGNKCLQQGPATQRYSAGVRPHSARPNNTHERHALTLQARSSFGSVPNRTMTCRVPNSCLRRTAVTHRSLNPGRGYGRSATSATLVDGEVELQFEHSTLSLWVRA